VTIRLLTWNLCHGRDTPPEPKLFTWRSRVLGVTERGERYAQVNRPLRREFTAVLAALDWDVALVQETPPRWHEPLARDLGATGACALTSRNSLASLRAWAAGLNPDLIASNEGGSNQTLARGGWTVAETRVHTLTERPERRRMLWTRLRSGDGAELAVANLHASVRRVPESSDQVLAAAGRAIEWAGELPLVFGGDLNHSLDREPSVFEQLDRRYGLRPPTAGAAIDHLLVHGLEVVEAPRELPDSVRELAAGDGILLRLSDHACVACTASMK
jgi:endonuclease/exonuclease/phosphatase family metal-dependent hydrolase